jgi:fluoride exporter
MIGLWVAGGSAIGAMARFALSGWVTTWAFAGFPWGTFFVNVTGCVVLGLITSVLPRDTPAGPRAFLTVGLCGGYTTFSTFDFEILSLVQDGSHLLAAGYAMGSATVCFAGILLGFHLGGAVATARFAPRR